MTASKSTALINRDQAQQRIERKVLMLERYLSDGAPPGAYIPNSVNTFRAWEDRACGIEKIGSPNTMSPTSSPHNKDLIERAVEAMRLLNAPKSEKPLSRQSKSRQVDQLKGEVAVLRDKLIKIAGDWHMAQQEIDDLKFRLKKADGGKR